MTERVIHIATLGPRPPMPRPPRERTPVDPRPKHQRRPRARSPRKPVSNGRRARVRQAPGAYAT